MARHREPVQTEPVQIDADFKRNELQPYAVKNKVGMGELIKFGMHFIIKGDVYGKEKRRELKP